MSKFSCFCVYKCFTLCKHPQNYDVKNDTYIKCYKKDMDMYECPYYRPIGRVEEKK